MNLFSSQQPRGCSATEEESPLEAGDGGASAPQIKAEPCSVEGGKGERYLAWI